MAGVPLVTGATGFAGSHLLDALMRGGARVEAWAHTGGRTPPALGSPDAPVRWRAVDLLDREDVRRALQAARPSAIYHCAGIADVQAAWRAPALALRVNVGGTDNLLSVAHEIGLSCRVLVTGSALVYRPSAGALSEDDPLSPSTLYGVSKLAQEMAAASSGLPVLLARPFNHAGPRQSADYVTSAFAQQLADIEAERRPPVLAVGNLESRRDITDVRDTVRAYQTLVERGQPLRPYNVCSGQAYRIRDLLDILLSLAQVRVRVEIDRSRLRPSDNPMVLGSHARLTEDTGWTPEIPIEQTLADLLDFWRQSPSRAPAGTR